MRPLISLPEVTVHVGGAPLDAAWARALDGVRVQQRLSLPAQSVLVFTGDADLLADRTPFEIGAALQVAVRGQRVPVFVGEVTALELQCGADNRRSLIVRGYDRLHRLRKRQSVRAYVQMTPGDLARQMAAEVGLNVEVEQDGALFEYLIQHRQSDLDFVTDVAERSGLYLTIREHVLHLITLAGQGDALDLRLGHELHQAQVELNADAACTEVSALGWNAARVEVFQGGVSSARSGRDVQAALNTELLTGRVLVDLGAELDAQIGGMAQAELDRRSAAEVVMTGTAEGDTRLRPGTVVRVSGIARAFDGAYVLTSVNHIINQTVGFLSELGTAPPPPRTRSSAAAVTLGVITQINDPESLGRVRIALPTYNQVETDWVNVLSAGAGAGKGLMLLPEVGDEVLVLLAHEDPAQAVVLGGLYGRRGMPDAGIDDGAVRRFTLLTPGGQRVRLDDTNQLIRLENSGGSFVELSPNKVHVHAAVDLEIEAPGQSIIVRGNTIDFQRG